ncbi:MAG: SGNH/GDSL hydrolase family protein [Lachnospiraceae bacterium]|nr:SGNH/GDSL hydrolase family protein [Lachnospiraceae bacterium]
MSDKLFSNKKRINIIKLLIVLSAFFITFITVDHILLLKSKDGISQMQSYYKQPENTVDALFVGSSHIFCHVNTGVLWDEYGISAFDLAAAEQPFWNSYHYIVEGLKTQKPEVIILDITTPGIRPTDYQPENWVITNNYGIKRNPNRYESIRVSALEESFRRLLVALNSTHGKYKELSEEDFMNYSADVRFKGFDARETVVPFETPDVSGITGRHELTEKEEKYLRKIIGYVKERNIPLLFISSPYVITTDEEQEKYNTIFDIADEYGIPYIDFNKLYKEMGIDFSTDLAEILHLNRSGNMKFTSYLGRYLADNYGLTDHRGDPRYSSWDEDALYQRQDTLRYNIITAATEGADGKFLDLLNNRNLVVFCSVPNEYPGPSDPSVIKYLEQLGLGTDMLTGPASYVLSGGQCIYSSSAPDFRIGFSDGNRRLLFSRTTDDDGESQTLVRTNGSMGYQCITPYESYEMPDNALSFYVYDTVLDKTIGGYSVH